MKELYARFRSVEIVKLIKVEVNEGSGELGDDDPIRRVCYLCTLSGNVVAKIGEEKERLFCGGDAVIDLDSIASFSGST